MKRLIKLALLFTVLTNLVVPLQTPYVDASTKHIAIASSTLSFTVEPPAPPKPKPKKIPAIMAAIAECESGSAQFYPSGKLIRDPVTGTHIGYFQISTSYYSQAKKLGYDIYTKNGNIGYALHMYNNQGTNPWLASRYCWG